MRLSVFILIQMLSISALAQTISPTIGVDQYGNAIAIQPNTNRVWLAKSKPNHKPNIDKKIKAHGPKNKSKHFTYIGISRLEIDSKELLDSLKEDVDYLVPDSPATISAVPTDPMWPQQWDMVNIAMPAAWDKTQGDSDLVVATFDTGADFTHPDLKDNLLQGWQCSNGVMIQGGQDDHGHGTHVAGAIGAVANNGIGISGMNWRVKIIPMKFLDNKGSGWISDCIALLDKAIELKSSGVNIRVGNNSWGSGGAEIPLQEAYQRCEDAGILSVCAAGNASQDMDSNPTEPAGLPNRGIISVLATDSANNLGSFSNYGFLGSDVAAPGVATLSTVPTNATYMMGNASGYRTASGTSMSSPHVAGLAALALSINPNLSVYELKDLILNRQSTDELTGNASLSTTGGKINAAKTLSNPLILNPKTNSAPVVSGISAYDTTGAKASMVSFKASDNDGDPMRFVTIDKSSKTIVPTNLFTFTPDNKVLDYAMDFFVGASDRNGGSSGSNLLLNVYSDKSTLKLQDYTVAMTVTNPIGTKEIYTRTWLTTNSDPSHEVFFKPYISGKGFNGWNYSWLPIGTGFTMRYSFGINTNGSYMLKSYTDNYQFASHPENRVILRIGTDVTNTIPFPVLNVRLDKHSGIGPLTVGFYMTNLSNLKTNNTFSVIGKVGSCVNCNYAQSDGAFYNGTITVPDYGPQTLAFLVQDHENDNLWDIQEFRISVLAPSNSPVIPPPMYIPGAPTGLTVTIANNNMRLNWIDNSIGEDRYEVEMTAKQKGQWPEFRQIATMPANSVSYEYSYGVKNSNYQFRTRSASGTNVSEYSNVASIRFK